MAGSPIRRIVYSLADFVRFGTSKAEPACACRMAAGDPILGSTAAQLPENACQRILTSASPAPIVLAPGADDELTKVLSIAGPKGRLLSNSKFTLQNLRAENFSDDGLLVFATHGMRESGSEASLACFFPLHPATPLLRHGSHLRALALCRSTPIWSSCLHATVASLKVATVSARSCQHSYIRALGRS